MPAGKPSFAEIRYYPSIVQLVETIGKPKVQLCLFLLLQDFCLSCGVVRNMNESQMVACVEALLDECDNFRMEDYVMMFELAKRGKIGDVFDRIDMQVVFRIRDEYWEMRDDAAQRIQQREYDEAEARFNNPMAFSDTKQIEAPQGAVDPSEYLREWRLQQEREIAEERRRKDEQMREQRRKDLEAYAKLMGLELDANGLPTPPSTQPQQPT